MSLFFLPRSAAIGVGLVCIFSGCSQVTGPMFQPVQHLGQERAVVYLYFPRPKIKGNEIRGILDHYNIFANDAFVTFPGKIIFAMEGWPKERKAIVDVEGRQEYFVRVSLIDTLIYARYYQLEQISANKAMQEINGLRLMKSCPRLLERASAFC